MISRHTATPVTVTCYRGTATTIIQPIHRSIFTQFLSRDHKRKGDIGNRKSKTQHDSTIVAVTPLPRQGLCRDPGQMGGAQTFPARGSDTLAAPRRHSVGKTLPVIDDEHRSNAGVHEELLRAHRQTQLPDSSLCRPPTNICRPSPPAPEDQAMTITRVTDDPGITSTHALRCGKKHS